MGNYNRYRLEIVCEKRRKNSEIHGETPTIRRAEWNENGKDYFDVEVEFPTKNGPSNRTQLEDFNAKTHNEFSKS